MYIHVPIETVIAKAVAHISHIYIHTHTQVYKDKLRELKKASRSLFKRVKETAKRPQLVAALFQTINMSNDFVSKMKNISQDLQIFTDVEINTLETLKNETEVGSVNTARLSYYAIS